MKMMNMCEEQELAEMAKAGLVVSSINNDEIWEDEIGSVYCYCGGGFVWIKQEQ